MADGDFSISAISSRKLQEVKEKSDVSVFKKALDSETQLAAKLIEGIQDKPLPPGIGGKVNKVA